MNRHIIEKRDQEVVEKFRTVVAAKERRKKKTRIRLVGGLLVLGCVGLIFLYKQFTPSPVPIPSIYKSNITILSQKVDEPVPPDSKTDTPPLVPDEIQIAAVEKEMYPQSLAPDKLSAASSLPEKMVSSESVPVRTPQVKTSGKKGLSEIPMQLSLETDIRIAEIITCHGVENRSAVSRQNVFSLKEGAKPYVWMDVRSKKLPYQLRHVYYLNGRRYCVVPLEIRYPRMRTWSNVTLRNRNETGQWRVDVITRKGEILSQAQFTVVP
jgi:hypothetical protein